MEQNSDFVSQTNELALKPPCKKKIEERGEFLERYGMKKNLLWCTFKCSSRKVKLFINFLANMAQLKKCLILIIDKNIWNLELFQRDRIFFK